MFYNVDLLGFALAFLVEYLLFISRLCALCKMVDLLSPLLFYNAVRTSRNLIQSCVSLFFVCISAIVNITRQI